MWLITKDRISNSNEESRVGVCSMGFTMKRMEKAKEKKRWFKFRMKDGDGNVYYEGFCDSNDDESAFAPLDDFGEPDAGCCSIEYWNGRRFEQL